ncbi:cellulose binding domain-containing protein [Lentzea sp. BCCO 10_0061]|uniref:Cellulose binding domain-containing protein n=1 Tax=Lentzea sokolovensis TaxID=3095429 RepID=A0ABU4V7P2_9PSEU|nr:cellulose binding domain-containing protein [Lentzea sp. BCCO 10_0061]MDX8147244.1 cellulose binding domain-containing protein [Lentzea sp. BCCO 10_0061]
MNPSAHIAFRVAAAFVALGLGGALIAAIVGLVLTNVGPAASASLSLCAKDGVAPAGGKDYLAQNNVWNAETPQCVTVGDQSLRIESAAHDVSPQGAPAATPSLLKGCHWQDCTDVGDLPVQVSAMPRVTSDWVTSQVDTGVFNAAYVVWFHSGPVAEGTPDGAEMVIWLRSRGGVRPGGVMLAREVPISDARWNVWLARDQGRVRITYERVGETTAVRDLDISAFTGDSVGRGLVSPDWYLIAVEAGFNLWRGGAGNAIENFSVSVDDQKPRRALGTSAPTPCFAALNVEETWTGGFRAVVEVTNVGDSPVQGWILDWTFPGGQHVERTSVGQVTQSGSSVHLVGGVRDGVLEPGKSTSFDVVGSGVSPGIVSITCTPA